MPAPGKIWLHIIISTKRSWLPGDRRGWRSRHHKIHCSGDYRQPPPSGEHAGLYRLARRTGSPPIVIPPDHRLLVGRILLDRLTEQECRCLAIAVGGMHVHLLAELPRDKAVQRRIIGRCKACSSAAVRHILPGAVWAPAGKFQPVRNRRHQRNIFRYIIDHARQGAWVWHYRQPLAEVSAGKQPRSQSQRAKSRPGQA